jgi:SAM-dependent methyltransferase
MSNPDGRDRVPAPSRYVLGHSDREFVRLRIQAALIEPITRRFFIEAGIRPGMRVLDVGSGPGDVSFLAADLVGDSGEVVGVDRAPAAVAAAKQRAEAQSLSNVSFHEGDPAAMAFEPPFDAIVARYVLMFQPDPAAMLRGLVRHLRPAGVIVFHEPDWTCARSFPPVPSWDLCCRRVVETMQTNGADMQMGMKLHSLFVAAGLPAPSLRLESVIGGGANSADQVHFTTDAAITLLSDMESLGLVAPGEIDPETLAERVLDDVTASDSVVVGRSEVGAWSRTQA